MRQTPAIGTQVAVRGLCAAVLLAVLHAAFTFGPTHLAQLGADDCRQRSVAAQEPMCAVPPVTLAAGEVDPHHQDRDGSQSCEAPGYVTQQTVRDDVAPASACTSSGYAMPACSHPTARRAAPPGDAAAPTGSTVLRC